MIDSLNRFYKAVPEAATLSAKELTGLFAYFLTVEMDVESAIAFLHQAAPGFGVD